VHVIATARNPAVLSEMAAIGMTTLALDVTKEDSIKTCHDEVSKLTGGKLDILVNNAFVVPSHLPSLFPPSSPSYTHSPTMPSRSVPR
jgi:1-acylglycerone phosphate reductase